MGDPEATTATVMSLFDCKFGMVCGENSLGLWNCPTSMMVEDEEFAPLDAQLCLSAEPQNENTNTGNNAIIAAIQKTNVHSATVPCVTIKFERT